MKAEEMSETLCQSPKRLIVYVTMWCADNLKSSACIFASVHFICIMMGQSSPEFPAQQTRNNLSRKQTNQYTAHSPHRRVPIVHEAAPS